MLYVVHTHGYGALWDFKCSLRTCNYTQNSALYTQMWSDLNTGLEHAVEREHSVVQNTNTEQNRDWQTDKINTQHNEDSDLRHSTTHRMEQEMANQLVSALL